MTPSRPSVGFGLFSRQPMSPSGFLAVGAVHQLDNGANDFEEKLGPLGELESRTRCRACSTAPSVEPAGVGGEEQPLAGLVAVADCSGVVGGPSRWSPGLRE